jgi:hypothetical protein
MGPLVTKEEYEMVGVYSRTTASCCYLRQERNGPNACRAASWVEKRDRGEGGRQRLCMWASEWEGGSYTDMNRGCVRRRLSLVGNIPCSWTKLGMNRRLPRATALGGNSVNHHVVEENYIGEEPSIVNSGKPRLIHIPSGIRSPPQSLKSCSQLPSPEPS